MSRSSVVKLLAGIFVLALLAFQFAVPFSASAGHGTDRTNVTVKLARPATEAEGSQFVLTLVDNQHRPISDASISLIAQKFTPMKNMHGEGLFQGLPLTATATPGANPGEYLADFQLSPDGEWNISVIYDKDRSEFSYVVGRSAPEKTYVGDAVPVDSTGKGSANPTSLPPGAKAITGEMVQVNRILGNYSLVFLWTGHYRTGEQSLLTVAVTDRRVAGAPVKGQAIEVIPVHLMMPMDQMQHDGGATASHDMANMASMGNMGDMGHVIPAVPLTESKVTPGHYEAHYTFTDPGAYLMLIRLGTDQLELATVPVDVTGGSQAQTAGPNYLFVGTILGVVALTIGMVATQRQRERPRRLAEVS